MQFYLEHGVERCFSSCISNEVHADIYVPVYVFCKYTTTASQVTVLLHYVIEEHVFITIFHCSLYRYCAEVTEPTEQYTTNWPAGTDERRFVICSPHRAFYILAENAEDRE